MRNKNFTHCARYQLQEKVYYLTHMLNVGNDL